MRNNKFLKALLAGTLAITLLAGLATPVSAETEIDPEEVTSLTITKEVETTPGTELPSGLNFQFLMRYVSAESGYPTPTPLTPNGVSNVGMVAGPWTPDTGSNDWRIVQELTVPAAGTITSEDLFATTVWPAAGVFTFQLREYIPAGATGTPPCVTTTVGARDEELCFDETIFEVMVWVHRDLEDGTLYIAGISIDAGDGKEENATFTNTFVRRILSNDPSALRLSKTVEGDAANTEADFEFTGTLTSDSDLIEGQTFRAFVYRDGGRTETYHDFVVGTARTFELRHGSELRFESVPVGVGFQFEETEAHGHTPSHVLTVNGDTVTGAANQTASNTGGPHLVGEDGANYAAFTNTLTMAPITGLLADNLPLILVGLAAIGFIGLLAVSRRRRAYEV